MPAPGGTIIALVDAARGNRRHFDLPGTEYSVTATRDTMNHGSGAPESKQPRTGYRAAVYALHGDFDPHEISRRVGFTPDRSWRKGQRRPLNRHFDQSAWLLDARAPSSRGLADPISNVLDRLTPSWSTFQQLGEEYDASVQCFVDTTRIETVALPADLVRRIAALHARIWIEVVLLEDEGTE